MLPMTLKLADKVKIDGESTIAGFEKQIDLTGLDHGVGMPMVADKSSNSRTSGKCRHEDFVCYMKLNKAYPKLLDACSKGLNLGKAEVSMYKMNQGKVSLVANYVLTDAFVSDVSLNSIFDENNSEYPTFKVSFNYQDISVTYNEYDSTGTMKGAVSCEKV